VDNCVRCSCQIFLDLTCQKLLKLVNFWQSYKKIKKTDVLGDTGYIKLIFCIDCWSGYLLSWMFGLMLAQYLISFEPVNLTNTKMAVPLN